MNALAFEINNKINKDNFIKSNEIICLHYNENILIKIKDNKINLFDYKNNHNNLKPVNTGATLIGEDENLSIYFSSS